jgi:hypothetical protein
MATDPVALCVLVGAALSEVGFDVAVVVCKVVGIVEAAGGGGVVVSMTIILTSWVEAGGAMVDGRLSIVAEVTVEAAKVAVIVWAVFCRAPGTPAHTEYAPRLS